MHLNPFIAFGMISFNTVILKFDEKGEKTGWRYIDIPADIADQLKPGYRKSFMVKGFLDSLPIEQVNLLPMGEGNFIFPLKADIRKMLRKNEGAMLAVRLEEDGREFSYPEDIMTCLEDDEDALTFFNSLPGSHRKYYIKWIGSAKTESTRIKRIAQMVNGCAKRMKFNEMMRSLR